MKNTIIFCILSLSFTFTAYPNILVGKVNIQKILLSVKQGKKVRDKLKKEFEAKKKIVSKEEKKIRDMQEDLKKKVSIMNAKTRRKKELEIQKKLFALEQKTNVFRQEMQALEQKLKRPIIDRIRKVVDDVSKNEKVDITFEVSVTPIFYTKNSKDLTDNVIKAYDKKYK